MDGNPYLENVMPDLCPECGNLPHLTTCTQYVGPVSEETPPDDSLFVATEKFPTVGLVKTEIVKNDRAKIMEAMAELNRRDAGTYRGE